MNIFLAGFYALTDSKQLTVFFTKRTPAVPFEGYNAVAVRESARPGQAFEWKVKNMEIEIVLEKHERRIGELEHEMAELKAVQNEIRTMNETLCILTNEIKHTNSHLERHERKLDEMEAQPSKRLQQIVTALISSICGALITTVIALMFG